MPPERRLAAFLREAKRRKVVRTALMYGGVSLALATAAEYIFPALLFPEDAFRFFIVLLILGFPIALVLAWSFDITAEGVVRAEAGAEPVESRPATAVATGAAHAGPPDAVPPPVRHAPRPEPATRVPAEATEEAAEPAAPPDPERVRKASLANLRQELLAPIDAIAGYSEMLLEDARRAELDEAAEILGKMHRAGGELRGMASSFLDPDGMLATASDDPAAISSHIRHELRNPVNALIGYAELLKEDGCVQGDLHHLEPDLDRLLAAAHRVNGLITRIAAFPVEDPHAVSANAEIEASVEVARDVLAKIRPRDGDRTPTQHGTLLIVDDNATNRDLISRRLAREGFTVATAESGADALRIVGERAIDLVLLDVLMPEMDGVEVLKRLKAEPRTAAIPVIMLSALDEIDSAIGCVDMGAEDFLPKSFDPVLLRVRIDACLELRRLRDRDREYARSLDQERALTEHLLASLCPKPFAERVLAGESDIVQHVPDATVVVGRFRGVRHGGADRDARATVDRMRELLGRLEAIARAHGVHILRADGAGFAAAVGLEGDGETAAQAGAAFALAALAETERFAGELDGGIGLRVGAHTGPITAGLLQTGRLAFDVWGEGISTARAIAAAAPEGAIHVSPKLYAALRVTHGLDTVGEVELEDVGQMRLFALRERDG
ncbi:MAG TPA: response regulator [Longimicrobiales bacterium]|nr:response regulator [Longimicrobiales bacterium]